MGKNVIIFDFRMHLKKYIYCYKNHVCETHFSTHTWIKICLMLRVGAKNAKGTHVWSLLNLMLRLSNIEKVKLVSLTHKGLFFFPLHCPFPYSLFPKPWFCVSWSLWTHSAIRRILLKYRSILWLFWLSWAGRCIGTSWWVSG